MSVRQAGNLGRGQCRNLGIGQGTNLGRVEAGQGGVGEAGNISTQCSNLRRGQSIDLGGGDAANLRPRQGAQLGVGQGGQRGRSNRTDGSGRDGGHGGIGQTIDVTGGGHGVELRCGQGVGIGRREAGDLSVRQAGNLGRGQCRNLGIGQGTNLGRVEAGQGGDFRCTATATGCCRRHAAYPQAAQGQCRPLQGGHSFCCCHLGSNGLVRRGSKNGLLSCASAHVCTGFC